jgi:hypothetical protein
VLVRVTAQLVRTCVDADVFTQCFGDSVMNGNSVPFTEQVDLDTVVHHRSG